MTKKRPTLSLMEAALQPLEGDTVVYELYQGQTPGPENPVAAERALDPLFRRKVIEKALAEFHTDPDVIGWVTDQLLAAEYWGSETIQISVPASLFLRVLEKLGAR